MASAEGQRPTCPVCQQSDQVKTMQAAYDSGVQRAAPPDLPTKAVSMSRTIIVCALLVGICIFSVLVLIGSEASLGTVIDFALVVITLLAIISALIMSYRAFNSVVKGDNEASERFPAWDRAMATWKSLRYCTRDNIAFDPNTQQVVSEVQLARLRSLSDDSPEVVAASLAHN